MSPCQLAAGEDGINRARDAITVASGSREGVGILDNDYRAAFDYMVLNWVFMVLKAKGLCEEVIKRLNNLYSDNLTVVVVNNLPGRCIPNNYFSIRQGDRQSSNLFCYGIDPHIEWLFRRLQGIPIYRMPVAGPVLPAEPSPPCIEEVYKVFGYIDDIKPARVYHD